MKQNNVVCIITSIRQANGILAILDQEKNNPKMTLEEVFEKFQKGFGGKVVTYQEALELWKGQMK